MKHFLSLVSILLLSISTWAQTQDDIAFFQSIWGMEKRAIVEAYMDKLTTDEAEAFWVEYDAYEMARKELGQEKVSILNEYAENYGNIHEETAKGLINKSYANNVAMQKLLKKTFKKMSKSLDAVKAAKFIQLENYFMTAIQMGILESIPFVDEFE